MRRLKRSRSVGAAGVVAAALLFLAMTPLPAQAAVPTITQMWPPNPAPGCQVSLTGTNYQTVANGGPASAVTFGVQPPAAPLAIDADTQLEATVPGALAASTASTVTVTNVTGTSTPAFAFVTGPASPTCPGVPTPTPTTGAVGSTVQLLGAFNAVPFLVRFNHINATITGSPTSTLVSVVVPSGAPAVSTIRVYTTAGVASATTPFIVTTSTVPTISNFTPTSGPTGTSVTINGTNLTGATSVTFNNVAAAAGWVVNGTGTQITGAIVPSTATDGPIRVTTPGGTAVSATNFDVTGPAGGEHPRTVSLQLSGKLKVSGAVVATDGFTDCEANVGVKIQRQKSGGWNTLTTLQTNSSGSYKGYVPAKSGKYRAKAGKITLLNNAVCGGDTSPTRSYNA